MKNDDINIKDVKIKFGGTELTEFDGDKVLCRGCKRNVELSDAEFCQCGDLHVYFCHRCLKIMKKINEEEGRVATTEDLKAV